ncbi:MAG: alpha-ketoacid dehydrogenase subunit beta, partial [Brevundimonas sp.]|nr:alpha-ketoacid dehydrogenase subunit beta [Brevundimonas sp.]
MTEQTFTEADRTISLEPDGDTIGSPAPATAAAPAVQPMNMIQALNSALHVKMAEDPNVLSFGEDAGYFGGVFRVTDQLQQKHGLTRSFDAPISECGIVAAAIGMGAYGLRPVVEIQFADYIYPAYDQIVSEAAKLRYRSAGQFT